ncbi:MAG TPA: YtxH domain-containing protein, partial [Candidatus Acidoferrum sp.]
MADNVGSKVTYFIVGLGVGALLGVLFAPKPGEETREFLTKKADEGKEYAQRKARELRERADELI